MYSRDQLIFIQGFDKARLSHQVMPNKEGLNARAIRASNHAERKNHMNKSILTVALACLALTGFAAAASGHEEDEQPREPVYGPRGQQVESRQDVRYDGREQYRQAQGGSGLGREVDHLNRMLQHVEREMRRYPATRSVRRQFQHLRAEAYELNNQFRRGEQYYNRRRVRAQIAHMHDELHDVEEDLHVPAAEFYQWR